MEPQPAIVEKMDALMRPLLDMSLAMRTESRAIDTQRNALLPRLVSKASVQESFRRLYPIRLATMHARLITEDDELYMYVETKRILTAIGVWEEP